MGVELGRSVTSTADSSMRREWLVTNGIGGYAMGALNLARTRRYHGILVAAQHPPSGRVMLVASLDNWLEVNGHRVPLVTHEWATGVVLPDGYRNLESFHLDGTLPVWTWTYGNAKIVQRLWMPHGENTTYVTYTYQRGGDPVQLTIKPLVTYRSHHRTTKGGAQVHLTPVSWKGGRGINILASEDLSRAEGVAAPSPFRLLTNAESMKTEGNWWWSFHLAAEAYRGLDDKEDVFQAGQFDHRLQPGETLAFIATMESHEPRPWEESLAEEQARQAALVEQSQLGSAPAWVQQLALAADQFVVSRQIEGTDGKSILAGYPWFSDWGRDTMIALPGITLSTGRYDVAAGILRTFARYVDEGMLPNHFPDEGGQPEYNTVDASLWYIVAIYLYLQAQEDRQLAQDLFPVVQEIIKAYSDGTRYGIGVDANDRLLRQGEEGTQLTWMDAKVDDWVITPRQGKPVEINALWYNALRIAAWIAESLGEEDTFSKEAEVVLCAFRERFWSGEMGYCYDVIDTESGDDSSLRPNQLFAISLPFPLLENEQAQQVVRICARHLLGSHGLRSLSPQDDYYIGHYHGNALSRDSAYHQGTMWGWLIGAFVIATLRAFDDPELALDYLTPLADHLCDHGLGTVAEIFDGDAPHHPRGCIAQAWSVGEILRSYQIVASEQKIP